MIKTKGYAAHDENAKFEPFEFERRDVGSNDILIEIQYAGICHSDIHAAKNEWEAMMPTTYPVVPGHEIVGRVSQVGEAVTKFKVGDVPVSDALLIRAANARRVKKAWNSSVKRSRFHIRRNIHGPRYADLWRLLGQIVIDENYALKVKAESDLAGVAPLMCAGITTYSPLRRFGVGPGQNVGIVGLGGLGHMGVKLAVAMGANVTVFSTSPSKEADAKALGAHSFVVTSDPANMAPLTGTFNFILDTVSADHDINVYINLLGIRGTLVVVGVPPSPNSVHSFGLIFGNKTLAGSLIGGIAETQEMLDFCAEHNIRSEIEVIKPDYIETAYDRTVKSDVRYRFVIDMANA